jgi:hypothetical protein
MCYEHVSEPTLPPLLAAELQRQYDVLRPLGRGGMGVVWLARERSLDRLVAIKVLAGQLVEATTVRERFRREARIAARLVHPHIVPLHAFGETDDALYFVMGYVEGETLASRLDREGRIPFHETVRILASIADALGFAHREGVVHRDVKPENILLDAKSGRAVLADFGVARADSASTSVTMTGNAVGTPLYMSPEQATGTREIDGRSDLYSLGVVGYRMLAGRQPFDGDSARALMAQHATTRPSDLALLVPRRQQEVARILMRAMEKDPAARWERGEDVRLELEAASRSVGTLPEALARIQGLGTKFLWGTGAVAIATGAMTAWNPRWLEHPQSGLIILYQLTLFPAIAAAVAAIHARKSGWRETIRAMFNPTAGWKHWWPRALRREEDIWDRLPKPLRRLRSVLDGVVLYLLSDVAVLLIMGTTGGGAYGDLVFRSLKDLGPAVTPLLFGLPKFVAIGWAIAEFRRTKRLLGLSSREVGDLLASPHLSTDAVWSRPRYARLLAAETDEPAASSTPKTPDEFTRAIVEMSTRLRTAGLLPDGESAAAAQSVLAAIEGLNGEIRRLASEVDPAEGERLERRLAGTQDDEVRRLLESQRDLWRRLQERIREKESRRDRLRDQLMTLWMQLLELDSRLTRGAPVDTELTGRVRALATDLGHVGDALSETERYLLPPSRVPTPV